MLRLNKTAIRILDNCAAGKPFNHGFYLSDKDSVVSTTTMLRKRAFIEQSGTNYRITHSGQRALTDAKNKVN
jgi:hypothetical protein